MIEILSWLWGRAARQEPTSPASRYADLLAAYAAASSRARAAERERRRLRNLIDEIPVDTVFGGWRKRLGEQAEIVDADAVRELLAERGLETPMKQAAPRLIVEFVGQRGEGQA